MSVRDHNCVHKRACVCCAPIVQYFGDIVAVIHDLQASIIRQLEDKVLQFEAMLLCVRDRLAELDVLMSFAEVSQDYHYCRPVMTPENVIYAKNARHPLQEVVVDTFVPNDVAVRAHFIMGSGRRIRAARPPCIVVCVCVCVRVSTALRRRASVCRLRQAPETRAASPL